MYYLIELAPGLFVGKSAKRRFSAEVVESMAHRFRSLATAKMINIGKNGTIRKCLNATTR